MHPCLSYGIHTDTINPVAEGRDTLMSHTTGGWKVKMHDTGRFSAQWGPVLMDSTVFQIYLFMSFLFFTLCVWVFYLHVYLCTACMSGTLRDQKRATDPSKLGLQRVMNCNVGAGNPAQVLKKSSQSSYPPSPLSSLIWPFPVSR